MRASGSRLPLAMACAYVARDDVQRPPDVPSPAAARGTARHAILEAELRARLGETTTGLDPAAAEIDDLIRWIANTGEWLDALLANAVDGCVWPERVYVYDAIAGSVRESPHKRSHDDPVHAADREMRCIADVVHLAKDGDLYVDDYKTGRPENIDHAAESWQLRALGLAAARFHGRDRVRVRMIHVDDAGRCRVHSEALLEPWDLEEIALALRDLALRIPTAQPTPGTWCRRRWCDLAGICPATCEVASRAIVVPEPPTEASYPIIATPLSPQHAAYLLVVLDLVKAFSGELEKNLKAYAKTAPIPLGDGRTWGPVLTPTTTIETSTEAIELLANALGPHATEALGITRAGIERAAKLVTKRGEGAALVRKIMAELEGIGAVKQGNRTEYTEVVTNG